MQALLLKDFFVVTKQLKLFLLIIPIMAIFNVGTTSAFAIIIGAALPMTAIAYDEYSKWDCLSAMMPYSKFELVFSKYLLGYICMVGAVILSFVGQIIGRAFGIEMLHISVHIFLFSIISAMIFIAINIPIILKFGSEKGRYIFILSIALIGASGPFLRNINKDVLFEVMGISPIFIFLAAIILNAVSVAISLKIKK